jgi:hypothetical protein
MGAFFTEEALNWISISLILSAVCVAAWHFIDSGMRIHDEEWMLANPPCFDVKPDHAAKLVEGMREPSVFASMDSLRRPLKDYRNPTPPGDSMDEYFAKLEASERAALKKAGVKS